MMFLHTHTLTLSLTRFSTTQPFRRTYSERHARAGVLYQENESGGCADSLVPANTTEMVTTRSSLSSRRTAPRPDVAERRKIRKVGQKCAVRMTLSRLGLDYELTREIETCVHGITRKRAVGVDPERVDLASCASSIACWR